MKRKRIKKQPYKLPWKELTPRKKELRERSLRVVSYMKRYNISLTKASKENHISPKTVIKHSNALKKVGGRWIPKRWYKIERIMSINENGKSIYINVTDSRHATTIGKYQNAVKQFLETGDESVLKPFKGKKVRDSEGNLHILETKPHNLYEIHERRENEEFYTIYYEG